VGGGGGGGHPPGLAGGLGQPDEGVHQGGVVGGQGQVPGAAVLLPRAQPAAVGAAGGRQQELAVGHRRRPPGRVAGDGGGLGQGGGEQGVPLGEHLVVEPGAGALGPGGEQAEAGRLDGGRAGQVGSLGSVGDGPTVEIAGFGDAPPIQRGGGVV